MQSRIREVATLAQSGERGRALAGARSAPPVPVTEQIVQEIKSLYPADPAPTALVQAPVSALFLSDVAEHVPITLRKMPRLSEPGPLGMRAEHWCDLGSLAGNSDLLVQVIAHLAAAGSSPFCVTVPQSWTDHTACQTHWRTQTAPHDVLFPQACSQISHGSQEGISGQMCWTPGVRSGTTGWCQHHDQDNSISCRG